MRWFFFIVHFGMGFLLLWFTYVLTKETFLISTPQPSLALEAFIETGYLLAGVIWGNLGWDTFARRLHKDASFSLVVYALSRTVPIPLILLPVFINAIDVFKYGPLLWLFTAATWSNLVFLLCSIFILIVYSKYRKSEMAVFYDVHGA